MQVSLVHNPAAGSEDYSDEDLLSMLRKAGYEAKLYTTQSDDLDRLVSDPKEMVVVAGGDGTVRKVALRLTGAGVPLAILPIGTANNISKTLGISGPPDQLIRGWPSANRKRIDVGTINSRLETTRFIEGVGFGVFPQAMSILGFIDDKVETEFDHRQEKLHRDLTALKEILSLYSLQDVSLTLDGKDMSGQYVMVEVMNSNFVGPNLCLAPGADPCDDFLDVVFVTDEERTELLNYLSARIEGRETPPELMIHRAETIEIFWDGSQMHVDDQLWTYDSVGYGVSPASPTLMKIALEKQPLEFLSPA